VVHSFVPRDDVVVHCFVPRDDEVVRSCLPRDADASVMASEARPSLHRPCNPPH
jgi:hypothetical protein